MADRTATTPRLLQDYLRLAGSSASESPTTSSDWVIEVTEDLALGEPLDLPANTVSPSGRRFRVIVRGAGANGRARLSFNSSGVRSRVRHDTSVLFERIDFSYDLGAGQDAATGGPYVAFIQDMNSCLRFVDCTARRDIPDPAMEQWGVFVECGGAYGATLGLRGLRSDSWGRVVRAHVDPSWSVVSPHISVVGCGFRDGCIALDLKNVRPLWVDETVFDHFTVGIRHEFEHGSFGGAHRVQHSRFYECVTGAVYVDRSSDPGPPVPRNPRPDRLACWVDGGPVEPLRYDTPRVSYQRNEFRAPRARRYPLPPLEEVADEFDAGRVRGETTGLLAEVMPSGWEPRLEVVLNVFHLLDLGVSLRFGPAGRVVIDRNTFVAVAVRALAVLGPVPTTGARHLTVTSNLFKGSLHQPWIGFPLTGAPAGSDFRTADRRYEFGAIRFEQPLPANPRTVAIVANVFRDVEAPAISTLGSGIPREVDELSVSPVSGWQAGNARPADPSDPGLIMLPRVRLLPGRPAVVEFDYRPKVGGAETMTVLAPEVARVLRIHGGLVPREISSGRDFEGRRVGNPAPLGSVAGALHPGESWEGFPLVVDSIPRATDGSKPEEWGDIAAHFDAFSFRRKSYNPAERLGSYDVIDAIDDGHGDSRVLLQRAHQHGLKVILGLPLPTLAQYWLSNAIEPGLMGTDLLAQWEREVREYVVAVRAEVVVNDDGTVSAIGDDLIFGWYAKEELDDRHFEVPLVARMRRMVQATDVRRRFVTSSHSANTTPQAEQVTGLVAGLDSAALKNHLEVPQVVPLDLIHGRSSSALDVEIPALEGQAWVPDEVNFPAEANWLLAFWTSEGPRSNGLPGPLCVSPHGRVCDHYPVRLRLNRDSRGRLRAVQDHFFGENYMSRELHDTGYQRVPGGNAPNGENRILAFHTIRKHREAVMNARWMQDLNLDAQLSRRDVFHNPGLMRRDALLVHGTGAKFTWAELDEVFGPALARHDFWAGVHESDGVWLYRWGHHRRFAFDGGVGNDEVVAAWGDSPHYQTQDRPAYADGLWAIKTDQGADGTTFREALANGERGDVFSGVRPDWLAAINVSGDVNAGGFFRALGKVDYRTSAAIWSTRTLGTTGWLIVTAAAPPQVGGEDTVVQFTPAPNTSVSVVAGNPDLLAGPVDGAYTVDFSGSPIDAVVLRIEPQSDAAAWALLVEPQEEEHSRARFLRPRERDSDKPIRQPVLIDVAR